MPSTEIFIAHPDTPEQSNALKAFFKALKIKFEIRSEKAYNTEFVDKIQESRAQYKNGEFTVIKTEDLWK